MNGLLDRIAQGITLVSDGGLGTLLIAEGLGQGDCPEELSLSRPDTLTRIAAGYARTGADVVHTNTFGASPHRLAAHGLEARTEVINRSAVAAAREGVPAGVLVSGSMGPCGRMLKPYGDLDEEEAFDGFLRQAGALVEAGVDAVTVETMMDVREAALAVRAARRAGPDLPICATMVFQVTPRGFRTMMGAGIPEAVERLGEAGADVLGSNCGHGIGAMVLIARAFRGATDLPLLTQSNAGLPEVREGVVRYPETPDDFAAAVPALLSLGVSIIGGCCGTGPEHVRAIRHAVDHPSQTP